MMKMETEMPLFKLQLLKSSDSDLSYATANLREEAKCNA